MIRVLLLMRGPIEAAAVAARLEGEAWGASEFAFCYELSADQLADLKAHCDKRKVVFLSTPMSRRGLADLQAIGVSLLKNGSDCLSHLDLVRAMSPEQQALRLRLL